MKCLVSRVNNESSLSTLSNIYAARIRSRNSSLLARAFLQPHELQMHIAHDFYTRFDDYVSNPIHVIVVAMILIDVWTNVLVYDQRACL